MSQIKNWHPWHVEEQISMLFKWQSDQSAQCLDQLTISRQCYFFSYSVKLLLSSSSREAILNPQSQRYPKWGKPPPRQPLYVLYCMYPLVAFNLIDTSMWSLLNLTSVFYSLVCGYILLRRIVMCRNKVCYLLNVFHLSLELSNWYFRVFNLCAQT